MTHSNIDHKRKHDHQNSSTHKFSKKNKNNKYRKNKYRRTFADQHLNDDVRAILKRFRFLTNQIRSYVVHCSEEQLLWSNNLSAWNIKQTIGFISIKDEFIHSLCEEIINAENREFVRPDTEEKMKQEEYNNRSIEYLMNIYDQQRRNIINVLYKSTNDHWGLQFKIDQDEMSLAQYLTIQLDNDEQLLDMIFMNLQRHEPWYVEAEKPKEIIQETNSETNSETNESMPIENMSSEDLVIGEHDEDSNIVEKSSSELENDDIG